MGLVRDTNFEIVCYLDGSFCSKLIRNYEDAAVSIKVFWSSLEQLDLLDWNVRQPFADFIPPSVFEWCWSNDKQRPVIFIDVSYADGLKSLTYSHLVSDQNTPKHSNTSLDSLFLKVVKTWGKFLRQHWNRLLVGGQLCSVVISFCKFCTSLKRDRFFHQIRNKLRHVYDADLMIITILEDSFHQSVLWCLWDKPWFAVSLIPSCCDWLD